MRLKCVWDKEGTCTCPGIGGTPAFPERCGACTKYTKLIVDAPVKDPPKPAGMVEKAASWAKAEVSLVWNGPLPDEEVEQRLAVCRSCKELDPSADSGKLGWCKACGCGRNARAELTVKGRMPKAKCPLDLWPKKPDT